MATDFLVIKDSDASWVEILEPREVVHFRVDDDPLDTNQLNVIGTGC
jgi:hypothetical protein